MIADIKTINNEATDTETIDNETTETESTDTEITAAEREKATLESGLDLLSNKYNFEFFLINMEEIKEEIKRGIQTSKNSYLSALSQIEKGYYRKLKLKKRRIQWIAGRYAVKSAVVKYLIKRNCDCIIDLSSKIWRSKYIDSTGLINKGLTNSGTTSSGLESLDLKDYYSSDLYTIDLNSIDVLKGQDSAPYILQYENINCSITHSYPFCIGVVSDKHIGIDIEKIFPLRKSVVHYFYSEEEKGIIENCKTEDDYARKSIFFWTRKEAVSKVLRLGMNMNFRELDTTEDMVHVHYLKNSVINIASLISDNFCLSIAVEG